jgi:hypothetical protein
VVSPVDRLRGDLANPFANPRDVRTRYATGRAAMNVRAEQDLCEQTGRIGARRSPSQGGDTRLRADRPDTTTHVRRLAAARWSSHSLVPPILRQSTPRWETGLVVTGREWTWPRPRGVLCALTGRSDVLSSLRLGRCCRDALLMIHSGLGVAFSTVNPSAEMFCSRSVR